MHRGTVPVDLFRSGGRDEAALGSLSPCGYLCTKRQVARTHAKPLVGHTFADFEAVRIAPGPQSASPATKAPEWAMRTFLTPGACIKQRL